MRRLSAVLGQARGSSQLHELARWLNPVAASPAAPRETVAALEAFGPSLMPRTTRLHGVAMGLGVLGARATTGVVEKLTRLAVPADAPLPAQLAARAVIGGAGAALPERHCQRLWMASLRSTGQLLRDGAAGAAVHDLGRWVQRRYPSQPAVRPIAVGAIHTAGLLYRAGRRLPAREPAVDRWPRPQTATLSGALATSYAVTTVGTGLARGFVWSRGALESYFGPGPSKRALARLVNAGLWAGAATAVYSAGVAYVGRANEKVEPGYATPPPSPLVSGSEHSLLPFGDLGQQGRRYVTDVVTPELIEEVMGEPAVAHPIRTYVRIQQRAALPDRPGRAGPGRAGPRRRLRQVLPAADLTDRHRLGRPHADRGRRAPHPRRHRHLLHPVRQVPVVPVGPEGGAAPTAVPAAAVGGQAAAGRPATRGAPAG